MGRGRSGSLEWFVYLAVTVGEEGDRTFATGWVHGPFRDPGGQKVAEAFAARRGGLVMGPFKPKRGVPVDKTAYSSELVAQWLEALTTPSTKLTPWEVQFLESVSDQFGRRGSLSGKQFEILERIYAEKTA